MGVIMSIPTGERCTVNVLRHPPTNDLETRIRGEYREMPGLRLRTEQAMRLWSLDQATCERVLNDLVHSGFLQRDEMGRFVREHGNF
jgi:Fic family protein